MDQDKLNNQSNYWEANFSKKPLMFGLTPSVAALSALKKFEDDNNKVRDTGKIIYASMYVNGEEINLYVEALDYSSTAIKIIEEKAKDNNLSKLISTKHFDIRNKLPYEDNSINGIFSHMLYCMALTNSEIKKLNFCIKSYC